MKKQLYTQIIFISFIGLLVVLSFGYTPGSNHEGGFYYDLLDSGFLVVSFFKITPLLILLVILAYTITPLIQHLLPSVKNPRAPPEISY